MWLSKFLGFLIFFVPPLLWGRFGENVLFIDLLKQTWIQVFILFAFFIWVGREKEMRFSLKFPFVFLILALSLSLFRSVNLGLSIMEVWTFLFGLFIYLLFSNSLNEKNFRNILVWLMLSATLVAVYSLLQHFDMDFLHLKKDYPSATFTNQNFLAGFLVAVLPLIIAEVTLGKAPRLKKVLLSLSGIVIVVGLVYTRTRGAWLAGLGAILFLLIAGFHWKNPTVRLKLSLTTLVILFLLLGYIHTPYGERMLSSGLQNRIFSVIDLEDSSNKHRLLMWRSSLDMIKDSPVIGMGIGTFQLNYPKYQGRFLSLPEFSGYNETTLFAHNEYLELTAETGFLGLGAFFWLLALCFVSGFKALRTNPNNRHYILGLLSGLVAILIYGFFSYPLHMSMSNFLFWTYLGSLSSLGLIKKGDLPERKKPNSYAKNIIFSITAIFFLYWTIQPFLGAIYFQKATNCQFRDDWDNAIFNYKRTMKFQHYEPRAHHNLAVVYERKGEYDLAVSEYLMALKFSPYEVKTRLSLAFLYERAHWFDKAIDEYQKVLGIYPNSAWVHSLLAEAYTKNGMKKEAEKEKRRAVFLELVTKKGHEGL